jgi:predicted HTH domain antitoxin
VAKKILVASPHLSIVIGNLTVQFPIDSTLKLHTHSVFLQEKIVTSVSTDSKLREVGYLGKQIFELSNHLGNVLATITDKKLQYSSNHEKTLLYGNILFLYLYLMKTLTFNIPDSVDLDMKEVAMLLATKLYEEGKLSLGQAAELVGLSKRTFAELLGKYNVSIFNFSADDLSRELKNV